MDGGLHLGEDVENITLEELLGGLQDQFSPGFGSLPQVSQIGLGLMQPSQLDMVNMGPMPIVSNTASESLLQDAQQLPIQVLANPLLQVNSNSTDDILGSADDMDILSQDPHNFRSRRNRKNRTPEQQKQNKLAQQRYRERKKQKYGDMEKAVSILTEKAMKLEQVEQQNAQLQGQNENLSKELQELQYEVNRLRAKICERQQFSQQSVNQEETNLANSKQSVEQAFYHLGQLIKRYELDPGNEQNLYKMSCEDSRLFGKLVSTCLVASINGLFYDKQEIELSEKDYEELMVNTIRSLRLKSQQIDQIIAYRDAFKSKMFSLHNQRDKLNLKVMSFLVRSSRNFSEEKGPTNFKGIQQSMKNDVQLQVVLEQLSSVMTDTKHCYDEFVGQVVKEVLGIVQRGVLVTMVHPYPFDVLALSDVVYQERETIRNQSASYSSSADVYVEVMTL